MFSGLGSRERLAEQSYINGDDTLERIMEQAAHLFSEQGYRGMSMSQLAEACSVSKPAIYYYFRDKQELYTQMLIRQTARHHRDLDRLTAGKGIREGLKAMVNYMYSSATYDMDGMMANITLNLDDERRQMVAHAFERDIFGPTHALFVQGVANGELQPTIDTRMITWLFMSTSVVVGKPREMIPRHDCHGQGIADVIVDTFLDGISNKENK